MAIVRVRNSSRMWRLLGLGTRQGCGDCFAPWNNLKVYAWCQCKLDDGSEVHYRCHRLVHVPSRKLRSFHRQRICLRKSSVLIMLLVCCVTWHAKTVNELIIEMEMVS